MRSLLQRAWSSERYTNWVGVEGLRLGVGGLGVEAQNLRKDIPKGGCLCMSLSGCFKFLQGFEQF